MAFLNPNDSTEVLYGVSGDVRDEINSYVLTTTAGHYADEKEIPGSLIIASLRKATRLINVFLEPVYPDKLPLSAAGDTPKYIDEVASDIGTYYTFRASTAKLGRLPDDKKRDYFDQYIEPKTGILHQIKNRELQIPELTAESPSESKSTRAPGRHPAFDVDRELSQGVDEDLIDDLNKERE